MKKTYLAAVAAVACLCATGWPQMRPLAFVHPERREYADVTSTYYLGDDLVVTCFADEEIVPPGTWYDWRTGEKVVGPATRPLAKTAAWGGGLLVRAGAIIPMWPVKQHLERGWNDRVELHVWPGAEGRTTLYEDDGDSLAYRTGAFALTEISQKNGTVSVGRRQGKFAGMTGDRISWTLVREPAGRRDF